MRWHALAKVHRRLRIVEATRLFLCGYTALRRAIDRRFTQRFFAWAPYLYGELGDAVEEEERALIDAGAIQATGFLYVGES